MMRLLEMLWDLVVKITLGGLVIFLMLTVLVGVFASGMNKGYADGYNRGFIDSEERRTELHEEYCA